ncbi:hypothetical protein BD626DRAFT_490664 [Schizophyllum amplum]|uniref:GDP-fucose protein O-fucosyltransferase-domain-containing protein n=1 Tax=Schizophyllum amplum TaxID=97359 RepID=A0A550CJQ6_9AGAR|nr:hypothetical protein BD626DRAFT_490664 [Auriculariopsis ampla]
MTLPALGRAGLPLILLSALLLLGWTFVRMEEMPSLRDLVGSQVSLGDAMHVYDDPRWSTQSVLTENDSSLIKDNLRSDTLYVTQWGMNIGMTNQILSSINLIYIGILSTRVPIIPPFIPNSHIDGAKSLPFGAVFDLPYLRARLQLPILEWQDAKPNNDTKEDFHCWAILNAMPSKIVDLLGVNSVYSQTPKYTLGKRHHLIDELANLIYPEHLASTQRWQTSVPYGGNQPDKHMACFDYLYYASINGEHLDWDVGLSWSAWRAVGQHLRYTPEVQLMAKARLRAVMGLPERAEIPPYIAVHMRRGDFGGWCKGVPIDECLPPVSAYFRRVHEVQEDLANDPGQIQARHVIVQSNERDPAFWEEVKALGYLYIDYDDDEQAGWWAIVIDACIQAMASGFVGTAHSTVSLISERRVQEWNSGVARMVQWGKLGADDH